MDEIKKGWMKNTTLHYIFDPICGWCYAAAPLIDAARQIEGLDIVMHAGGLWTDANVKQITSQLRDYVVPNDQRIAQITGQPFGDAYFNGLLTQTDAVLDSQPPITAILAVNALNGRGLDLLHAIQVAHYVEGRQVSTVEVLRVLAAELNISTADFDQAYVAQQRAGYQEHIQHSRDLMDAWQVQGFPAMVLEHNGQFSRLNHAVFYGQPEQFAASFAVAS